MKNVVSLVLTNTSVQELLVSLNYTQVEYPIKPGQSVTFQINKPSSASTIDLVYDGDDLILRETPANVEVIDDN